MDSATILEATSPSPHVFPLRQYAELLPDREVGQSFMATRDGLAGIAVRVKATGRKGNVTFHLKPNPESPDAIYTVDFALNDLYGIQTLFLRFPPLQASCSRPYYFGFLARDIHGDGTMSVAFRPTVNDLGQMHVDRRPRNARLTHRPLYGLHSLRVKQAIHLVHVPEIPSATDRREWDRLQNTLKDLSFRFQQLEEQIFRLSRRCDTIEHMASTSWRLLNYIRAFPLFPLVRRVFRSLIKR